MERSIFLKRTSVYSFYKTKNKRKQNKYENQRKKKNPNAFFRFRFDLSGYEPRSISLERKMLRK